MWVTTRCATLTEKIIKKFGKLMWNSLRIVLIKKLPSSKKRQALLFSWKPESEYYKNKKKKVGAKPPHPREFQNESEKLNLTFAKNCPTTPDQLNS